MVKRRATETDPRREGQSRAKSLRPDDLRHEEPTKAPAKRLTRTSDEGGRQVVRLLTMLKALEGSRMGLTVAQLHEVLEGTCDERTVRRGAESLERAGFPLVKEGTRWKLIDTTGALKATPLRSHEVFTLLLTGDLLEPIAESGLAVSHAELRRRLAAELIPKQREFLAQQRRALRGTYLAPTSPGATRKVLEAIEYAQEHEHCLRLVYGSPNKATTERIVEPHLFWVHAGRPYLVAYCRTAGDFRKFAAQRVQEADVLEETFERRADFDAQSFIARGFGMLHGQAYRFIIHFDHTIAHLARERTWHVTQVVSDNSDGTATLEFTSEGLPEVAAFVASFGGKLRAESPRELVDAVRALHAAGLVIHGGER